MDVLEGVGLIHDWTATVTRCGRICRKRRKINGGTVFVGQDVGVRQVSDQIWLVSVMDDDLGTSTTRRVGSSRSRIPSARKCYLCLRSDLLPVSPKRCIPKVVCPTSFRFQEAIVRQVGAMDAVH